MGNRQTTIPREIGKQPRGYGFPAIAKWRMSGKWKHTAQLAALGALLPATVVALWHLMSSLGAIDELFMPPPLAVVTAFGDLLASGELFTHLAVSLRRASIGFALGGGLGLLLGVMTGFSRRTEQYLDPTLQVLRLTPNLALAPLFILWFGFGELSKIVMIANIAFFPLYLNAYVGIRNVDNKLVEVTRVLGYGKSKQIRKLIFPASVPNILLGLRLSLAGSWLGLVVAEIIGSSEGIGYLIAFGQSNNRTDIIFVGVIIFAIMGKLVDSLVRVLERKLLVWQDSYKG